MNTDHKDMLVDFQNESKGLVNEIGALLEACEEDFARVQDLAVCAQIVDRIVGAAQTLAEQILHARPRLEQLGDYTALFRLVATRGAQVKNEALYQVCVAFLLDANEVMAELVENLLQEKGAGLNSMVGPTFIDRLQWLSKQFAHPAPSPTAPIAGEKMNQAEIDELMKKLGLG